MARLDEICVINMGQSPDSLTYNEEGNGLPFFQGNADFGEIYPMVRMWCSEPTKIAQEKDILISVRAPIGALNIANCECCIGRGLAGLTVNEDICVQDYLWYALSSKVDELNSKGTGSTFKAINKKILAETEIPLLPLAEQRKIAAVLDKVSNLIAKRRQQLDKLDELVKSRFIEMVGDPVQNPLRWSTRPLLEMGYCKNGMNFHTGDCGIEMHCLGVGDFKNYSVIDGTNHLPIVSLNETPSEESMLQDGDIVFVRSNGNKALVGRCLVVYPRSTPTTYSGFCIRYRLTSDEVNITYLLRVLKTDSMRERMAGRGANIQNLNQQILATLDIPTPPMELQEQFAAFVETTDKSKYRQEKCIGFFQCLEKNIRQEWL